MLYKVKGYAFIEKDNKIEKSAILDGYYVHSYEEVRETFKNMGIKNYLFLLSPVEEEG